MLTMTSTMKLYHLNYTISILSATIIVGSFMMCFAKANSKLLVIFVVCSNQKGSNRLVIDLLKELILLTDYVTLTI